MAIRCSDFHSHLLFCYFLYTDLLPGFSSSVRNKNRFGICLKTRTTYFKFFCWQHWWKAWHGDLILFIHSELHVADGSGSCGISLWPTTALIVIKQDIRFPALRSCSLRASCLPLNHCKATAFTGNGRGFPWGCLERSFWAKMCIWKDRRCNTHNTFISALHCFIILMRGVL